MTTPSEIRSLYVETLARVAYENRLRPWSVDPAWADLSEQRRQMYVHMGMQATDALAAAGLLPTTALVETCVAGRDGECQCPTTVRYVTDPREVSE